MIWLKSEKKLKTVSQNLRPNLNQIKQADLEISAKTRKQIKKLFNFFHFERI